MSYFFTSESVSEGHPDKIADQISDAILDNFLAFDPNSKVACETLVTTGQVVLSGEIKSNIYVDVQKITRDVISKIGYTKSEYKFDSESCGILSMIHEQSEDINRGVEKNIDEDQGAGDQGLMLRSYLCFYHNAYFYQGKSYQRNRRKPMEIIEMRILEAIIVGFFIRRSSI